MPERGGLPRPDGVLILTRPGQACIAAGLALASDPGLLRELAMVSCEST